MRVVPDTLAGQIEFAEARVGPWTDNSEGMGSSPAAVTSWAEKVTAAREAYLAQQQAQNAARAATLNLKLALDAMNVATGDIIRQVRTKAATAGDEPYSLAMIPAPAKPSPVAAPGVPYQFKTTLRPDGSLELAWKCDNARGCTGVIYQVYRKAGPGGEYTYLGGVGKRKFLDATLPPGPPGVTYRIQATRSTAAGDAAEFVVNLGVSGGVTATTTPAAGGPAKMAA